MEIIKLTVGKTEEIDASFAEGLFSCDGEQFYVLAIASGEMTLLLKSDVSLEELHQNLTEDEEYNTCEYCIDFFQTEDNKLNQGMINLDLEILIPFGLEGDSEFYQCWRGDGNEGLCEAAESDTGFAFVIVYDLLARNDFSNTFELLGDDTVLSPILNKINELFTT